MQDSKQLPVEEMDTNPTFSVAPPLGPHNKNFLGTPLLNTNGQQDKKWYLWDCMNVSNHLRTLEFEHLIALPFLVVISK